MIVILLKNKIMSLNNCMKSFTEWKMNESYNPNIDGPPLEPHTLMGARTQIQILARNIRTTFGLDEKWNSQAIHDATQHLEQAAMALAKLDNRIVPHKFHSPE